MTSKLARRGTLASFDVPQTLPAPSFLLAGDGTFWQDSARTTPATADGDPVGAWDDASVSAAHALQATAGKRPLLKTAGNGLNSIPVLRFDGTDDALRSTLSAQAAQTVFIVARKNSAVGATADTALAIGTGNGQVTTLSTSGTGYLFYANQAGAIQVCDGTPTNWNIIALALPSTSSAVLRVGGGAGTTFDPNDSYAAATLYALGESGGAANFGDYDYAEIRRYDLGLNLTNHNVVGNELATKYGLSWTAAA